MADEENLMIEFENYLRNKAFHSFYIDEKYLVEFLQFDLRFKKSFDSLGINCTYNLDIKLNERSFQIQKFKYEWDKNYRRTFAVEIEPYEFISEPYSFSISIPVIDLKKSVNQYMYLQEFVRGSIIQYALKFKLISRNDTSQFSSYITKIFCETKVYKEYKESFEGSFK